MTTIVHTTDLLDHDRMAFEHSIALARSGHASLVSLHAQLVTETPHALPDAAAVLRRWGHDPAQVPHRTHAHLCCDDIVDTVLDGLRQIGPDLVVAATHERGALARLFRDSRAEAIAHNASAPILLFPDDAEGFIDPDDGHPTLERIVVPVGDAVAGQVALHHANELVALAGIERVEVVVLFVGRGAERPSLQPPAGSRLDIHVELASDDSVEAAVVERTGARQVVVMATRGQDSLLDVLRGSHTDRVLHRVRCPLLSVRI